MLALLGEYWYLIFLFFLVATLYSSVGFGGGSSYLAILALTGIAFTEIRATALLCNIVVVSGNVFLYHQQKKIVWKKIIPLILTSVPLAYLGGYIQVTKDFFFILLGFTLLFAALTMWFSKSFLASSEKVDSKNNLKNSLIGGVVGFVSGMVGIGGGIFLAPLLHLINWNTPKKIAAAASVFIFANSISGLAGQYSNPEFSINWQLTTALLITVFLGGQLGNRISNKRFTQIQIKKVTAILIAYVSLRILMENLF